MSIERQEIHCHACGQWVQFNLDTSVDGNHVLNCPNCNHEHCRVVRNGRITGDRWDTRNGPTVWITSATTSSASVLITLSWNTTNATGGFLYDSWTSSSGVTGS